MGYVDTNLGAGERVVHRASLHWAIFLPGLLLTPVIIGLPLLLWAWVTRRTTEMAVTNQRVIIKTGWIERRTLKLNLAKVETIIIDQGILGRLQNYGTLTVVGTGGSREPFKCVASPLEFRRAIQTQVVTPSVAA